MCYQVGHETQVWKQRHPRVRQPLGGREGGCGRNDRCIERFPQSASEAHVPNSRLKPAIFKVRNRQIKYSRPWDGIYLFRVEIGCPRHLDILEKMFMPICRYRSREGKSRISYCSVPCKRHIAMWSHRRNGEEEWIACFGGIVQKSESFGCKDIRRVLALIVHWYFLISLKSGV
jgi:hypothetical protein